MSNLIRLPGSIPASGDLEASQYLWMRINSDGRLFKNTSSGAYCDGVLQDTPDAAGVPGIISKAGDVAEVIFGGTVDEGALVMSDGNGKTVTATSGSHILGRCLTGGAANGRGRVLHQPTGKL